MPAVRRPNEGPYVVSWISASGQHHQQEAQSWRYACYLMRQQLVAGMSKVTVAFC